jgi:hypothetical protein
MKTSEIINLIVLILISPLFAMLVVQLLRRCGWNHRWTFVFATAVGVLVGLAQCWANGSLPALIDNWGAIKAVELAAQVGTVWGFSQIWYHTYFTDVPWMAKLAKWPAASPKK